MRVKNNHSNTAEFSQQTQQGATNSVSEELESRFNNALKSTSKEKERDRLFTAALRLDAKEQLDAKSQLTLNMAKERNKHTANTAQHQKEEEALMKNNAITSSSEAKQSPAEPEIQPLSLNGLSHDPKAMLTKAKNDSKDHMPAIQIEGKAASAMQHILNDQQKKAGIATKESSALNNTQINAEAKAALSAFESKVKAGKQNEQRHVNVEADPKLHTVINLNPATAQGDIILRNMETQAPQNAARDMNELMNKLVDKIYVSLPTANEKEVRLLLNEGQLKGGEISIKQDSSGYSVLIKQEHAHSLINQNAKQDLTERLQRLGIDQPIRVAVTEQMNQQQDQQRSRQQRSIYDEWKPEDE